MSEQAFERALRHLQNDETPSPSLLSGLGNPATFDAERFREVWRSLPLERRRRIARELLDLAEWTSLDDFGPLFFVLLDDPDPEVRAVAVDGLWETSTISMVSLMRRLIEIVRQRDEDTHLRARAVVGLGRLLFKIEMDEFASHQADEAFEMLQRIFADEDEPLEVRRRALEGIAARNTEEVHAAITKAFDSGLHAMKVSALFSMGRTADRRWREIIARELESPHAELRYEAARAAGELEDASLVPPLVALLNDPDPEVREVAIWSLGQIGTEAALRALRRLLEHTTDENMAELIEEALEFAQFMTAEGVDADHDLFALLEHEDDPEQYVEIGPNEQPDEEREEERNEIGDAYTDAYEEGYGRGYVEDDEQT